MERTLIDTPTTIDLQVGRQVWVSVRRELREELWLSCTICKHAELESYAELLAKVRLSLEWEWLQRLCQNVCKP